MSDEPLYCPLCGEEHCDHAVEPDDHIPDEKRYCEVCGIIPAPSKHCHFWGAGGNREGCSS